MTGNVEGKNEDKSFLPKLEHQEIGKNLENILNKQFPITAPDQKLGHVNINYSHAKPEPRRVEANRALKRKMSSSPELTPEKAAKIAAKIIDACELPDFTSNIKRKSIKPDDISTSKGNINDGVSR